MIQNRGPTALEKISGCFLGVLLGDALGMPWETMRTKEIMLATRNQGVTGFSDPKQTRIRETAVLKAGDYTDDWRLTRAVAKSLVATSGFDLMNMIKQHLLELEDGEVGFGASTLQNLLTLREKANSDWKSNPNPQFRLLEIRELKGKGAGNGVAIKIAPLAIYFNDYPDEFLDATDKLSLVTHRDPQAMLSAYALGILIINLYRQSIGLVDSDQLQSQLRTLIQDVIRETLRAQEWYLKTLGHKYPKEHTDFSLKLIEVGRLVHSGEIANLDLVKKNIGTGFYCAESIPFSIAMFFRNPTDFRTGILETINSGGDTDSNASMVGALIGTNLGALAIPEAWRTFREEYQEAGYLALNMYNVMPK